MLGRGKRQPHSSSKKKKKMTAAWTSIELGIGAISVLMIVLGALIGAHWEEQIDERFLQEMVVTPTSEGFSEWKSPSVPIVTKMYFWNWTNPNEMGQEGYKPVLKEVGPYVFHEKHDKVNMTWNENGTVTYRWQKFYYFRPEESVGNLTDNITSVNVIAATMSEMSLYAGYFQRMAISTTLTGSTQKRWWTHTVAELTFDGFKNPFQTLGSLFSSATKDKFGYFYGFNGSISTDVYSMSTGAKDIFSLGDIAAFNFETSTAAHSGNCSQYRGSLGELWSPHLSNESVLAMFTPDMCRTISYYYEGESSHNGIPSLVFSSDPRTVDNGTLVEENACYCHPRGCVPSGVYDLRTCKMNAPVFMSLPHLHLADPTYRDGVVGMDPQHDKHKFMLEMEARTGVPLKVAARLQLNVNVVRNSGLRMFSNIESVLLPVWWMETVVALPPTHTSGIQLLLNIIFFGPFIAGSVIFLGAVLLLFITCRRYNAFRSMREKKSAKGSGSDYEKSSYGLIGRSEMTQISSMADYPSQGTIKLRETADAKETEPLTAEEKNEKLDVNTGTKNSTSHSRNPSESKNVILDVRL